MRPLIGIAALLASCAPAEDSRVDDHEKELADLRLKVQVLEEKIGKLQDGPAPHASSDPAAALPSRYRLLGATDGDPMTYSSMAACLGAKAELQRQRAAEEVPQGYRVIHSSLTCAPEGG